ncbi:MAG: formyltetrahydrofolate deformylase [Candidatus Berkiella sp.]
MKVLKLEHIARLLIRCPDGPGIVASVTTFLKNHGANITDLQQHSTDPEGGKFFMRLEFQTPHLDLSKHKLEETFKQEVATPFKMDYDFHYALPFKRMAVFVSLHDHCLLEILWRWSRGELALEIPFIISNHKELEHFAQHFKVPFHYIPVEKDKKIEAEQMALNLCKDQVDGIILARYMQILSKDFVEQYPSRIINIHHSFLPAFVGANPYQQAYDKGVKLIGATAHYVTEDLDMGPIIAQDVALVTHRDNPYTLKELGRNVERNVLAKALRYHLDDKIIVDGNKTVIFD